MSDDLFGIFGGGSQLSGLSQMGGYLNSDLYAQQRLQAMGNAICNRPPWYELAPPKNNEKNKLDSNEKLLLLIED